VQNFLLYATVTEIQIQPYVLYQQGKQQQQRAGNIMNFKEVYMREEYDFSKTEARRNPYAKKLKKQITINIDNDTIDFFKEQSEESGILYQTLINLYLSDCAKQKKQLYLSWK